MATNGEAQDAKTEKTPGSEAGANDDSTPSPSLEELERQLAEMEATQSELASRLQEQADPQLDSHMAVIEEQFRQSFDERLREGSSSSSSSSGVRQGVDRRLPGGAADSADVLLVNRVFREVSRYMGDEWRPVFNALMSPLPPEVADQARHNVIQHPALIQV